MATVIITVRMNEASMREANPHVPWSPEEIAADAADCVEAGAAVVHFHGRDPVTGGADRSPEALATTVELIDGSSGAITYCNLGAGAGLDLAERLAPLAHDGPMPELAPVDLGSFNLDPFDRSTRRFATEEGVYVNTVATVRGMVEGIVAAGVTPVAVAWGIGSLRLLDALVLQERLADAGGGGARRLRRAALDQPGRPRPASARCCPSSRRSTPRGRSCAPSARCCRWPSRARCRARHLGGARRPPPHRAGLRRPTPSSWPVRPSRPSPRVTAWPARPRPVAFSGSRPARVPAQVPERPDPLLELPPRSPHRAIGAIAESEWS